jgi:hypothetical protein
VTHVARHAVVATTIPRSADGFYGPMIDELRERGFRVHVVTSPGPEIPRLLRRADEVHPLPMARGVSVFRAGSRYFGEFDPTS